MSLLAASKITANPQLRARVEAAIRKTGGQRLNADGPEGALARAGYTAPETVAAPFMLRVSTNGDVEAAACEACGHCSSTEITDATIEWIIGDAWAAIAADLYPGPTQ